MHKPIPILLIFFLLPAVFSKGQETTSEISGVITEKNAPLADVIITAIHKPTGTKYRTFSRSDGRYNLANMKIGGPYIVTASFVGYRQITKDSITLLLGQEYILDFTMMTESKMLDSVAVQSLRQGKVFNANHTGPQEIIKREHFLDLPTINRSIRDFAELFPSANNFSFAGRNGLYNNITLDAANFTSVFGFVSDKRAHISGQPLSIESVEQMQVNVAPYDVRQGGFAGTNINVVSRSGTNKFKGSLYSYITTPGLTGYKVGDVQEPKEVFTYNRTGFYFSGPIKKDKLFFFINGEHEHYKTPATTFIASDETHAPGANVSLANADTLNKLRQFLIDRFKYAPGVFQNYDYRTYKNRISVKIDWNAGINTTVSVKYNFFGALRDDAATNNGAPRGYRQPGVYGMPFSGSGITIYNRMNSVIAELNTNWKGNASNQLQVGYLGLRNYQESIAKKNFPTVDIIGPAGETYTTFGLDPYSYNNMVHINIFQFADMFTLYKRKHEISIGTQNYIKHYKSGFAPFYAGAYRFKSMDDFYDNVLNKIPNASNYLLQYSTAADHAFPYAKVGVNEFAFFAQDKIRFKNKLVFTYGLRLDLPVFEDGFPDNPNVKTLTFRDGKHYNPQQKPGVNALLSPRISFNWDISKKVRTQLRGGAGLFAGPPPLIWLSNIASNNGAQLGSLKTKNILFSTDITAYIPDTLKPADEYSLALIEKNFKYPQVLKTNIAIDRLLPGGIIGTLEATYAKDITSIYFQNVNLPSTGIFFKGPDNRMRYDSTVINPNVTNAILMTNSSKGFAYCFTFQLQKRMNNYYFGASYSYTKSKTLNDGGALQPVMWSNRPVTGDPNAAELGYADFYQPHRVVAYGTYRKEYAKHFATAISFIFEAAPAGVGSYTYNGDMNNDGTLNNNNDLIYIPKNKTDIVLVQNDVTDTRTTDEIWTQLNNYIMQDKYLRSHRGKYAERNGVVFPFFKQLDVNIAQEFMFGKHTVRLSLDIINVGNLINSHWGTYKILSAGTLNIPYNASILSYQGTDQEGRPKFSFPYLDPVNKIPLTQSFTDDLSIFSRWQMQFGIRYMFD